MLKNINNDQSCEIETLNNQISRIKAENALLRSIIAHIPGNIYWKDKNGYFIGCNNNVAHILGYKSPNEVIGKRNHELFDPSLADITTKIDTGIIDSNQITDLEEKGLDINKNPAIYLTKKSPLYNEENEIIGILGVSLDITERKKMEEDLKIAKEQAEATSLAKSEFVANLSHDVKTPLAGIIGMAELLTYRLKEEKDIEFAQLLLSSGRQLLNFFDNCLDAFKLESDITLITESFHLSVLIDDMAQLFEAAIRAKKLSFNTHIQKDVPNYLTGCQKGLYRILLNLIANAVKFTHKGNIFISINHNQLIDQSKVNLHITIEDTGIGIPKDKLEIIFDRFTRLIPSYKGTYEGNGIGLYIVKRYIEAMQGDIRVYSKENTGTRFDITLPFEIAEYQGLTDQNNITQNVTIPRQENDRNKPIRILLVEDNYTAQMIQQSLLISLSCEVEIADSGEKALEQFEAGKFGLILLDIGLPGIQGDSVANLIRKLEQHSHTHVPIIALTAHTTADITKQYLTNGIDAVYSKPLTREQAEQLIN